MAVLVNLQDPDSARALVVMLNALDTMNVLDDHQEMVADIVVTSCYEQETGLDPDELDAEIAEFKERLRE